MLGIADQTTYSEEWRPSVTLPHLRILIGDMCEAITPIGKVLNVRVSLYAKWNFLETVEKKHMRILLHREMALVFFSKPAD